MSAVGRNLGWPLRRSDYATGYPVDMCVSKNQPYRHWFLLGGLARSYGDNLFRVTFRISASIITAVKET